RMLLGRAAADTRKRMETARPGNPANRSSPGNEQTVTPAKAGTGPFDAVESPQLMPPRLTPSVESGITACVDALPLCHRRRIHPHRPPDVAVRVGQVA